MKANNHSQYIIGITVILCSAALLAALTFALSGFSVRAGGRKLAIDFHDATGIKLHSAARYAGKAAGTVAEIRYLSPEERLKAADSRNAVRVTLQLSEEVPPLLDNITAKLDAETLLGEKFIALTPGLPDGKVLAEGAVIQGGEVSSIDAVARSARTAIDNVNDIIVKLKGDYPALVPRLAELLSQGNAILSQGSNLVSNVDSTVLNANGAVTQLKADYANLIPDIKSLFTQAKGIATNANFAMLKVNDLVERLDTVVKTNQGDLTKIFEELRVVSQNLKVITTYTKTLTATLAEKPSRLIWSRNKNEISDEKTILESGEPIPSVKPRK